MIPSAKLVDLGAVELKPALVKIKQLFVEEFGQEKTDRIFFENDWKRLSYAMQCILPGKSILDVGTGQGLMVNALACTNEYARVTTIDMTDQYNKYRQHYPHERFNMNVTKMGFKDEEFDVVVCMEVIEHLQGQEAMFAALAELDRVAAKQLIVTVPLLEPLPLPKYHHQQFDLQRISDVFSGYECTVLFKKPVTRVPWLMLEKRKNTES